jgi:NAD(P)-dependent dehydrogenase (short-subunit alcohol dehydrogenase family)
VVLITGATSGIGRATANAFAMQGAKVMFCGRREALGAEVEAAIRKAGGEARFRRADVRVEADVAALVADCVRAFGGLDIAFNNAGIGRGGARIGAEFDWATHQDVMATNLDGVIRGMNHEVPALKARGGGAIINTASVLGYAGSAGTLSYGLSKAGVLSVTRSAALQLAADNIRVNAVSPGPIDTPMMGGGAAEASGKRTPAGRAGQPEEIARAVLFLAGEEASYITGEDLRVDGGSRAS